MKIETPSSYTIIESFHDFFEHIFPKKKESLEQDTSSPISPHKRKRVEPLEQSQPRFSARSAKLRHFENIFHVYLVEKDPKSNTEAICSFLT